MNMAAVCFTWTMFASFSPLFLWLLVFGRGAGHVYGQKDIMFYCVRSSVAMRWSEEHHLHVFGGELSLTLAAPSVPSAIAGLPVR